MKTVKCNICGKKIGPHIQAYSIEDVMGYGSKFDGAFLELDICPDCMDKIINNCKLYPLSDIDEEYETCEE